MAMVHLVLQKIKINPFILVHTLMFKLVGLRTWLFILEVISFGLWFCSTTELLLEHISTVGSAYQTNRHSAYVLEVPEVELQDKCSWPFFNTWVYHVCVLCFVSVND